MIIDGVVDAGKKVFDKHPILTILSSMMFVIILFILILSTKIGIVILAIIVIAIAAYAPVAIVKTMLSDKPRRKKRNETLD